MSSNINFSLEIHNIEDIHQPENKAKKDELYSKVINFFSDEGLLDDDLIIDFEGKAGNLVAYTTCSVIISRAYIWGPEITKKWEYFAKNTFGGSCKPLVHIEYVD